MENFGLLASTSGSHKEHSATSSGKFHTKIAAHDTTSPSNPGSVTCLLCGSSHYIAKCGRYQSKTLQQRRDIIMKHRRCFNCFGPHAASKCNYQTMSKVRKKASSIHDGNNGASSKYSVDAPAKNEIAQSKEQPQLQPLADWQSKIYVHHSGQALLLRKLTLLATSRPLLQKNNGEYICSILTDRPRITIIFHLGGFSSTCTA